MLTPRELGDRPLRAHTSILAARCYEVPWVCAALGRDGLFWLVSVGFRLFRGSGGGEGDGVTELFELPNEEPSSSFWLIAAR